MTFTRDYHQRWLEEIRWLLNHIDQQPAKSGRVEETALALAVLSALKESMPMGITIIQLQRITSCDDQDILAFYLILGLVPNLPYRLTLMEGVAKLLPL